MKRGKKKKRRREQVGEVQTESEGFFFLLSSRSSKSSCPEVEGRCLNFQKKGQGPVSDRTGRERETKTNEILHLVSHKS